MAGKGNVAGSFVVEIGADGRPAIRELQSVEQAGKQAAKNTGDSFKEMGDTLKGTTRPLRELMEGFTKMVAAPLAIAAGIYQIGKALIDAQTQAAKYGEEFGKIVEMSARELRLRNANVEASEREKAINEVKAKYAERAKELNEKAAAEQIEADGLINQLKDKAAGIDRQAAITAALDRNQALLQKQKEAELRAVNAEQDRKEKEKAAEQDKKAAEDKAKDDQRAADEQARRMDQLRDRSRDAERATLDEKAQIDYDYERAKLEAAEQTAKAKTDEEKAAIDQILSYEYLQREIKMKDYYKKEEAERKKKHDDELQKLDQVNKKRIDGLKAYYDYQDAQQKGFGLEDFNGSLASLKEALGALPSRAIGIRE